MDIMFLGLCLLHIVMTPTHLSNSLTFVSYSLNHDMLCTPLLSSSLGAGSPANDANDNGLSCLRSHRSVWVIEEEIVLAVGVLCI